MRPGASCQLGTIPTIRPSENNSSARPATHRGWSREWYLPTFDTVEEERLHRKQRLAATYRIFARLGFEDGAVGAAGHVTVRDPGDPETFWVNPWGVPFSHITVSNLIRVGLRTGKIVDGEGALLNGAAFAIHSQIHAARPDVVAAAHSHSMNGKTFSDSGAAAAARSRRTPARSTTTT